MTDEWTRAEKRKAQSEQAKAIMDFVSMLSDKINELEKENEELKTDKQYWEQKANRLTTEWGETLDQLTKAKGLLKQWQQADICDSVVLFADTEQFLKEIEK